MPTYDIQEWNSVITDNNTQPMPMIYIKADDELLSYAKDNNYSFQVTIQDTESFYDTLPVVGVMYSTATFPNLRPNFFDQTKFLAIVLWGNWIGYPKKNGQAFLQGTVGDDKLSYKPVPFQAPKPFAPFGPSRDPMLDTSLGVENYKPSNSFSESQLRSIVILLFFIFCVFLSAYIYKKPLFSNTNKF